MILDAVFYLLSADGEGHVRMYLFASQVQERVPLICNFFNVLCYLSESLQLVSELYMWP